jgi:hypothetical protein
MVRKVDLLHTGIYLRPRFDESFLEFVCRPSRI